MPKQAESTPVVPQSDRAKTLAAMRARLLREKLLKQQKSTSISPATSPAATSTNTSNSKKRSVKIDNAVNTSREPNAKIDKDLPRDGVTGCALRIDGFRRPLQIHKVEEGYQHFRMNSIKSFCFMIFDDADDADKAAKCKAALDGTHFPRHIPAMHAGKLTVRDCGMVEPKALQEHQGEGKGGQGQVVPKRGGRGVYHFETKSVRGQGRQEHQGEGGQGQGQGGGGQGVVVKGKGSVKVKATTPRSLYAGDLSFWTVQDCCAVLTLLCVNLFQCAILFQCVIPSARIVYKSSTIDQVRRVRKAGEDVRNR